MSMIGQRRGVRMLAHTHCHHHRFAGFRWTCEPRSKCRSQLASLDLTIISRYCGHGSFLSLSRSLSELAQSNRRLRTQSLHSGLCILVTADLQSFQVDNPYFLVHSSGCANSQTTVRIKSAVSIKTNRRPRLFLNVCQRLSAQILSVHRGSNA